MDGAGYAVDVLAAISAADYPWSSNASQMLVTQQAKVSSSTWWMMTSCAPKSPSPQIELAQGL